MKMRLFFLTIFIAAITGFVGCMNVDNGPAPKEQEKIVKNQYVGTWYWIASYGGLTGLPHNPEIDGYDQTLYILPEGDFVFTRQHDTIMYYSYVMDRGSSIYSPEITDILKLYTRTTPISEQELQWRMSIALNNDTLRLDDNACDGYSYYFVKNKRLPSSN